MFFPLAVYNFFITTTWPYSMQHKLRFLIWGFCGFNLSRLLCVDLTGNHRWICIPWKEKAPQLPEHKGQREKLIHRNEITHACSSSLQQPADNIDYLPFTDVQCNLWKGHCAQSALLLQITSIQSYGIYIYFHLITKHDMYYHCGV